MARTPSDSFCNDCFLNPSDIPNRRPERSIACKLSGQRVRSGITVATWQKHVGKIATCAGGILIVSLFPSWTFKPYRAKGPALFLAFSYVSL